ncbi:MAG: MerR family DNA-binding transcriptional regulator [Chloroflexi bacterium]|nr:MerR family DNA-binding transcriptional regulator [Chloroflexota bacterium]
MHQEGNDERQWLPLRAACRLVEANQATLRHWADRGLIRAFRTPGGHRRFSRQDLASLVEGELARGNGRPGDDLARAALRRMRRRLRGRGVVHLSWYGGIDGEGRTRMRLFGRRLLGLAAAYLGRQSGRQEVLVEARLIGEAYGQEMARLGLSLEEVIQAFAFFRNSLMEAVGVVLGTAGPPGAFVRGWLEANRLADEVLQALGRAYEGASRKAPAHLDG